MSENALTPSVGGAAALPAASPASFGGAKGVDALKARFTGFMKQPAVAKSLPLLGLPITEPFETRRPGGDQTYTVQYFERARMERFAEFAGTPFEVQFGLLGREVLSR